VKGLDTFAVGNLQLSVGKLQIPAPPNFFSPRRHWGLTWKNYRKLGHLNTNQ